MSIIQAIIMGIVQGLTEYLPISSSAHLVIVPFLLGWKFPDEAILPFDVLVQLGTLAAVIIYFWADLWAIIRSFVTGLLRGKPFAELESRLGWLLILATVPAGIAGLLLKKLVDEAFQSVLATGLFLFVTALLLLAAEWIGKRTRSLKQITWMDALWMGIAQAVSIFPGVSRSGATITGGMVRHLDRTAAARFSFLMSIPVMLAASALEIKDVLASPTLTSMIPQIAIGILAAGLVGYLSIRWMLKFVSTHSLRPFAVYCVGMGILIVLVYVILPH